MLAEISEDYRGKQILRVTACLADEVEGNWRPRSLPLPDPNRSIRRREIMARYPNITWILAHAGGTLPYLSMRLRLMDEFEVGRKPPFPFCRAGLR